MIRPATPTDRAFILSGWSSSLKSTRDIPFILSEDWARVMRPVLEKALDRSECLVSEGDVLRGFIAFDRPDYVAYCYVAQPYRGWGEARALFKAAGIDPASRFSYGCRTRQSWLVRHKIPNAIYDPFRYRFSKKEESHGRRDQEA